MKIMKPDTISCHGIIVSCLRIQANTLDLKNWQLKLEKQCIQKSPLNLKHPVVSCFSKKSLSKITSKTVFSVLSAYCRKKDHLVALEKDWPVKCKIQNSFKSYLVFHEKYLDWMSQQNLKTDFSVTKVGAFCSFDNAWVSLPVIQYWISIKLKSLCLNKTF